jgi:hypothetical protein
VPLSPKKLTQNSNSILKLCHFPLPAPQEGEGAEGGSCAGGSQWRGQELVLFTFILTGLPMSRGGML